MKKIFAVVLIASAFFTVSASAQTPRRGSKGINIYKQTLMDSLQISGAKADSVIAIQHQLMQQMRSIMSDQSISFDDKKAKTKPIRKESETRLKQFLSDDQIAKLRQMQINRRQTRGSQNQQQP